VAVDTVVAGIAVETVAGTATIMANASI
jgi:hypothetical protein